LLVTKARRAPWDLVTAVTGAQLGPAQGATGGHVCEMNLPWAWLSLGVAVS
jgi:hypothetical protein